MLIKSQMWRNKITPITKSLNTQLLIANQDKLPEQDGNVLKPIQVALSETQYDGENRSPAGVGPGRKQGWSIDLSIRNTPKHFNIRKRFWFIAGA